jgi:hypothetical protein
LPLVESVEMWIAATCSYIDIVFPLSDVRSSLVVCITYHRMIKNLSHSSKGSCLNSTSHFGMIKGILLHLYKLLTGRIKLVG